MPPWLKLISNEVCAYNKTQVTKWQITKIKPHSILGKIGFSLLNFLPSRDGQNWSLVLALQLALYFIACTIIIRFQFSKVWWTSFPSLQLLAGHNHGVCNIIGERIRIAHQIYEQCHLYHDDILGTTLTDTSPFLYPFVIEYALIGASVFFVMWRHVGRRYLSQLKSTTHSKRDLSW